MAKAVITLDTEPTFPCKVDIPAPGSTPIKVGFTFKGRTREEYEAWIAELGTKSNVDAIMEVASGWDLQFPFDRENLLKFDNKYMAAARVILNKYIAEVTQASVGN